MSDERLRLIAEIQNRASAEIKKIAGDLSKVKPSAGMLQTGTWFQKLTVASEATSKAVRPVAAGLNTIGASGLAAGLSVAGLVKQFTDLAKAMPALQELSRQTGISRTEIERLKATASNLNVDPSKMTASLSGMSRMLVDFHRKHGDVYEEMVNHGASGLAEKIRQEDPAAAYRDLLKWIDAIPASAQRAGKSVADSVQIQRHWAEEVFGDADMVQMVSKGMGGFEKAYGQAAKDVGEITDQMVAQAEALDRSIASFERTWKSFETSVGPTVFDNLRKATDDFREVFDTIKGAVTWFGEHKDHPLKDAQDAALSAIDAQAAYNKAHPEGIVLDVPGLLSKGIHGLTDWAHTGPSPAVPVPTGLQPMPSAADDRTRVAATVKAVTAELGASRPAAFHPAALGAAISAGVPGDTIAAAVKTGTLEAFREWESLHDLAGGGVAGYGGGGGAGGGVANLRYGRNASGGRNSTPGTGSYGNPSKSLLDFIAQSEGGGYNVSWGNGKFLPGGHEQNLTGKTLNEILALGDTMRRQPGARNSSAMGRYQITGSTLRDLMGRMGLKGDEKFDEAMQDRLASKLLSDEGPRALGRWEGLKRGSRMSTAMDLLRSGRIAAQPAPSFPASGGDAGPKGSYPAWMDERSKREMAGINAPLARDLLAASEATGTHFRILQGLRTSAEAEANARRGVGVRNSQHLYGAAADLKLTDANGRDLDRNDPAYARYAAAYEAASRAHGGKGRWLGHVPGWSWDRAHFDQGIGYGEAHQRDPYGIGGPTEADKKAGSFEIFRGSDNPLLKAAGKAEAAAQKAVAAAEPRVSDDAYKAALGRLHGFQNRHLSAAEKVQSHADDILMDRYHTQGAEPAKPHANPGIAIRTLARYIRVGRAFAARGELPLPTNMGPAFMDPAHRQLAEAMRDGAKAQAIGLDPARQKLADAMRGGAGGQPIKVEMTEPAAAMLAKHVGSHVGHQLPAWMKPGANRPLRTIDMRDPKFAPAVAPLPKIAPEPPRPAPSASRNSEDDPAHVHVHLHQDGRLRTVKSKSSPGVSLNLHTGRTMTNFA